MHFRIAIFLCAICTLPFVSNAQSLDYIWGSTYGDGEGENDQVNHLLADSNGNIYAAGTFEGVIDFDNGNGVTTLNSPDDDEYLAKYDTSGSLKWALHLDCSSRANINDLKFDNSGNLLVCGNFINEFYPNPQDRSVVLRSNSSNNSDFFFAKYNANGELIWAKSVGGGSVDNAQGLTVDDSSHIYLTGNFGDTTDFDPSTSASTELISSGFGDIYIAKYDSTGSFIWAKSMGASLSDYGESIQIDKNGDLVMTGVFTRTVDFDPSSSTANLTATARLDVFIAKYSRNGAYKWAKALGGNANDYVTDLRVSASGSIYIHGDYENTFDFDPSSSTANKTSNGRTDVYLAKYNANGDYEFAVTFGGNSNDRSYGIDIGQDDQLFLTGYFVGTVDFDPSSSTSNLTASNGDIFISAFDSSGNYEWAFNIGSSNFESGYCIEADASNNLYAGGYFAGTADFDPGATDTFNLSTPGSRNNSSYFAKYSQDSGDFSRAWTVEDRLGGDDQGKALAHDSKGNVVVVGNFRGAVSFDQDNQSNELSSNGNTDVFVAQYDSNGFHNWSLSFGSASLEYAYDVTVDGNDDIIITGVFNDSMDIDPSGNSFFLKSNGSWDVFVVKYNSRGQLLWGTSFGGRSLDAGFAVEADSSNDIWVSGYFRSTVDFNPGSGTKSFTARNRDIFLSKFRTNGDFVDAFFIGGNSNNYGRALVAGTDNCIYLSGEFRLGCDFDPSSNTASISTSGTSDPFIAKYDSTGKYIWAKGMLGGGSDRTNDIALDSEENIYICGNFQSSNDFDPNSGTATVSATGGQDFFLAKYDSSGNYQWAHGFGNNDNLFSASYGLDVYNEKVYITGYFNDTVDFDPLSTTDSNLISINRGNIFVARYDSSGDFDAVRQFICWNGEGHDVSVFNGSVFTTGLFQVDIDLNPDPNVENVFISRGRDDIYLARLGFVKPCKRTSATIKATLCGPYLSPAQNLYHKSGTYLDTILNQEGCDSIITIELTINNTFDTLRQSVCESYRSPSGKVFSKSGIYQDTLVNSANCDSVLTIILNVQQDSVFTQIVACDSFRSPSGKYIYRQTGLYKDTLTNAANCDSIINIDLTILKSSDTSLAITQCDSVLSPSGKSTFFQSGVYFDTLTNRAQCDSIIELRLEIPKSQDSMWQSTACDSFFMPDSTWAKQSGSYEYAILTQAGCDSNITISLEINASNSSTVSVSSCGFFVLPNLQDTIRASGNYVDSTLNKVGCDSLIFYEVEVLKSSDTNVSVSVCDSFVLPASGTVVKSSGFFTDTLVNRFGCDSIVRFAVEIKSKQFSRLAFSACDSFQLPSGKVVYNSGSYSDTILAQNGCDSIMNISLNINESKRSQIAVNSCQRYTLPSGKRSVNSSGVYYDTLQTVAGCDSIIEIALEIEDLSSSIDFNLANGELYSLVSARAYQWYECKANDRLEAVAGANDSTFRPNASGDYALEISGFTCEDTSSCLNVQVVSAEDDQMPSVLSLYPNPASNIISVKLSRDVEDLQYAIYSASGKTVKAGLLNGIHHTIEVKSLRSGLYIIHFFGEHMHTTKVLGIIK